MLDGFNKRVVNCRFVVCGLHFDAAVDCDWNMHCYWLVGEPEQKDVTPIELYCFDRPDWDIRMMYHTERNDRQTKPHGGQYLCTCVDLDEIKKEARKWVREMTKKK